MKNVQNLFLIAVLLLTSIFTACHKHNEEGDAPVLTIEKPTEGSVVSGEVHIHGKTTDNSLHAMEIVVTRDDNGMEIFKATPKVHDKTEYVFDEHFTPVVSAETALTLVIKVEDHSDQTTSKTVKFKVKP